MKVILRTIFLGRKGLRAGWRLLIFLVIAVALQPLLQLPVVWFMSKRQGISIPPGLDPVVISVAYAPTLIGVLIATGVLARFEDRRLRDYGLPGINA